MSHKDLVLLDTCVLMSNPDIIFRVKEKGGTVFVTNTVLDELDYNKKGTDDGNRNARHVLREMAKQGVKPLDDVNGVQVLNSDVFSFSAYKGTLVNIIHRDAFRTSGNNDEKIIEIAKDYSLILISADQGMVVRAQASGIRSYFWKGGEIKQYSTARPATAHQETRQASGKQKRIRPFRTPSKPIVREAQVLQVSSIPSEGDIVSSSKGQAVRLKRSVGKGGEGEIFETDVPKVVCKIYKPEKLTDLRKDKIELMLTRDLNQQGITWPKDYVVNQNGEFVGYTMSKAHGVPLQPTIFVKPHFEKRLPSWTRKDLAIVCLKFLEHMQKLHDANILVGDINPLNVLVNADSNDVWLVDTDSFQIEGYPCPVGTVNFTAPEIQGQNYGTFLRTKDHELFAVATMLFMILLPGKPPYSQEGGGTPGENIKRMMFPYPFHNKDENIQHHGSKLPSGPYRFMWSHLSFGLKQAFHETFRENRRVPLDRWRDLIGKYLYSIEQGYLSDELFPRQNKITDGVEVSCSKCGAEFTAQKQRVEEIESRGKSLLCSNCLHEINLIRLERKRQDAHRSHGKKDKGGQSFGPSSQGKRPAFWKTRIKSPQRATATGQAGPSKTRSSASSGSRKAQSSSGGRSRSAPSTASRRSSSGNYSGSRGSSSSAGFGKAFLYIGAGVLGFYLAGIIGAVVALVLILVIRNVGKS